MFICFTKNDTNSSLLYIIAIKATALIVMFIITHGDIKTKESLDFQSFFWYKQYVKIILKNWRGEVKVSNNAQGCAAFSGNIWGLTKCIV